MKHSITLIPGDGVGPEVVEAARRALEATGVEFQWELVNAGAHCAESARIHTYDAITPTLPRLLHLRIEPHLV